MVTLRCVTVRVSVWLQAGKNGKPVPTGSNSKSGKRSVSSKLSSANTAGDRTRTHRVPAYKAAALTRKALKLTLSSSTPKQSRFDVGPRGQYTPVTPNTQSKPLYASIASSSKGGTVERGQYFISVYNKNRTPLTRDQQYVIQAGVAPGMMKAMEQGKSGLSMAHSGTSTTVAAVADNLYDYIIYFLENNIFSKSDHIKYNFKLRLN